MAKVGPVARLDLAAAGTDVDAQGIQRDLSACVPRRGQVDRACPDHAGHVVLSDQHGLAGQLADVDAADDLEAEQALAVIGHQHEANFVHVGGKHHVQALFAGPGCGRQHIAECVHLDIHGRPLISSSTIRRTSPSSPETAMALHSFSRSLSWAFPIVGMSNVIPGYTYFHPIQSFP